MTTLQRYFLEQPFDEDGIALITGDDSKHIMRVMRMEIGDKVIAVSNGEAYISTISEMSTDSVSIRREEGPLPYE